jgi:hypothetical protein
MHKGLLTRAATLALLTMLAGCGTPSQETAPGPLTASGKPQAKPATAACLSIAPITPNRGKPEKLGPITTEEIAALLDRDNPIDRVRNWVGDTSPTLTQIDKNNAAREALCGK